jgi:iron(III) transport system ATP-binding protein
VVALDSVSLALHPGRITCLLGPSGSGKSTLLRVLAGLEPIDGGTIAVNGKICSNPGATVPPEARGIGLVFQDFALFPHLTVAQNVAFGLDRLDRGARRVRALELLDGFKLAHRADAWPHTLSGGEMQRVAIARALARQPAALLLDEPFSGLDGDLKAEVRALVLTGLRAADAAILIVTHDPEEAMLAADDLALMSAGTILQSGSPQDCYLNPVSIAAARLLGPTNLVPARIEAGRALSPFGWLPVQQADGPAALMIRLEGLRLVAEGAPVNVRAVQFGGAFFEVTVEAEGVTAVLRHNEPVRPEKGHAQVSIVPDRSRVIPL